MKGIIVFIIFIFTNIYIANAQYRLVNVTTYGANGSDQIDDTNSIQAAIDKNSFTSLDTLFIPTGTYIVSEILIKKPMIIRGEDGTIIKKISGAGKWSRMLTLTISDKALKYKVQNLTFDGNLLGQGDFLKYQLEQQHLLRITGNNKVLQYVSADITDCAFLNSVADGVSIGKNVNVSIKRCIAKNVFRGAIVVNGGNTTVKVDNFKVVKGTLKTGVAIEISEIGFDGTKKVNVDFNDVELQGKFNIGIPAGGHFKGSKIVSFGTPFNLTSNKSDISITNSIFYISANENARINFPFLTSFIDCEFITKADAFNKRESMLSVFWSNKYRSSRDQLLIFKNCTFKVEGISRSELALYLNNDNSQRNNRLILDNVDVAESFNRAIYVNKGGNLKIINSKINSNVFLDLVSDASGFRNYNVELDNVTTGKSVSIFIKANANKGDKFIFKNLQVGLNQAKLDIIGNIDLINVLGFRSVLFEKNQTKTGQFFKTDIFKQK